ncbi:pentapeptide repeat-containing protein [Streptomyces lincolnensis]|uniref:pentapeptide repeat-containing protein n=1 Tax=Streptomyces lincolnensis TaxID=1915 RepID=UPI0037D4C83F
MEFLPWGAVGLSSFLIFQARLSALRLDCLMRRFSSFRVSYSSVMFYLYILFRVTGRTRGLIVVPPRVKSARNTFIAVVLILGATLAIEWGSTISWLGEHIGVDLKNLEPDAKAAAQGQLRLAAIQLAVAVGALMAIFYTARTYRLTRRGQVTDRFTKALERLSSEKEYVRIGGILALGQILHDARDQSEDAQTVLQNYLVNHTPEAPAEWPDAGATTTSLPAEVQTAVDALGTATRHADFRLRLSNRTLTRLDLRGIQLVSADLSRSDFRRADLEGANLWGTNLFHADLRRCDLRNALFVNANLRGARLQQSRISHTSFAGALLKYAVFSDEGTYWSSEETSFRHANLTGAILRNFHFVDCDFRDADLGGANLSGATFERCRLARADLTGTDLHGADLRGSLGIVREQLKEAKTNTRTQFPSYLGPTENLGLSGSPSPPD